MPAETATLATTEAAAAAAEHSDDSDDESSGGGGGDGCGGEPGFGLRALGRSRCRMDACTVAGAGVPGADGAVRGGDVPLIGEEPPPDVGGRRAAAVARLALVAPASFFYARTRTHERTHARTRAHYFAHYTHTLLRPPPRCGLLSRQPPSPPAHPPRGLWMSW
jgi:hypothetical protein